MKYTKEQCIQLLILKSNTLNLLPKKSDFSDEEVMAIKAHLGPWPRALEAAGLKPPRDTARIEKNREKRIRAKRKRIQIEKDKKKGILK